KLGRLDGPVIATATTATAATLVASALGFSRGFAFGLGFFGGLLLDLGLVIILDRGCIGADVLDGRSGDRSAGFTAFDVELGTDKAALGRDGDRKAVLGFERRQRIALGVEDVKRDF